MGAEGYTYDDYLLIQGADALAQRRRIQFFKQCRITVNSLQMEADGTWVFGNVAIKSGDYVPLEESGYSISLKYNYEHKLSAPQIVVIDYPHVRFSIGCQLMQMFLKFFVWVRLAARLSPAV